MKNYGASGKLNHDSKTVYFVDHSLAYDHLRPSYQASVSLFGTDVEPSTFEEACIYSRWVEALSPKMATQDANDSL